MKNWKKNEISRKCGEKKNNINTPRARKKNFINQNGVFSKKKGLRRLPRRNKKKKKHQRKKSQAQNAYEKTQITQKG